MELKTLFLLIWYGAFLLVPLLWLLTFFKQHSKFVRELNQLPGPPIFPILGNVFDFCFQGTEEFFHTIQRFCKRFPRILRIRLLQFHVVALLKPSDIEVVLSSIKHIEKSKHYGTFLNEWMGTGLLTSGGSKWHKHRKLLTPAFHFRILEQFTQVFHENSHVLLKKLQEQIYSPKIDILHHASHYSLDVICETAMGIKVNALEDSNSEYINAIQIMHNLLYSRITAPWLHFEPIFNLTSSGRLQKKCMKIIHSFTRKVIVQRREYLQALKSQENKPESEKVKLKRLAFLDLLIEAAEADPTLTDEDIKEEVDTFMFEGHDTVSTAISWALFLLGTDTAIQEKAVEELRNIFGDSDRSPTLEDLASMRYLERCIKEALRLYPSVPYYGRHIHEDIPLDGFTLPAGAQVGFNVYHTHRNPEYFPNPEVFNPDNFLPERIRGRNPYAYIPFSAGPRNCIGQKFAMLEMKSVISAVLQKFRVEAAEKREDVVMVAAVVLKPKDGVHIRLFPRNPVKS